MMWMPFDSFPLLDYSIQTLNAGVDKYSHKRNGHRKGHSEPLCKACRIRKVRGKCRNQSCKKREGA